MDGWAWKPKGTFFIPLKALCFVSYPSVNWNLRCHLETLKLGSKCQYFSCVSLPCEGWPNETQYGTLPCFWKLSGWFHSHLVIPIGIIVGKRSNWSQFMTVWPWNLTDDLHKQFGASLSFVLHLVASSYSLETPHSDQNWRCLFRVTLKVDRLSWKR